MGQVLSCLFGSQTRPTSVVTETVPVRPSYTSAAHSRPSSSVSQASTSRYALRTNNVQSLQRRVPTHSSSNNKDFVRELNRRNNCSGESFVGATYDEGERIKELITEYLPYVNITRICVVKNSYLQGMYDLKKSEYISRSRRGRSAVREITMYHATDARNAESIVRDNLDWRLVYRNKYGIGVSFSEDPDYCNFHCSPRNGFKRVFVVASVLVCQRVQGHEQMVVPRGTADTAVGRGNLVYVKFNDNEFMPKYLVFYDKPARPRSRYWVTRR